MMLIDVSELLLTIGERLRVESHLLLGDFVTKTRAQNKDIKIKAISMKGEPKLVLLKLVEDIKADCIVLGSRGLGKLKGSLLGSVSSFLINQVTTCPVIAVK
ncbi:hypothetical protein HDU83_002721 [Entophlyctis luteolus]|nr:hypothetical protein HDU83_002721 [Entophlyctis luteolus]KAJ3393743.1 hypothetical protein HDU84_001150 [Entophlyctis sp. JEL0112]